MSTLAGFRPDEALVVRGGQPMILRWALLDAEGAAQDLTGRAFRLIIRRSSSTEAALDAIDAVLSNDKLYAVFAIQGSVARSIYDLAAFRSASFDMLELIDGAAIARDTGRIVAEAGADEADEPITIDTNIPFVEALVTPTARVVNELGSKGDSASRQFANAGLIDEDTPEAMFEELSRGAVAAAGDAIDAANDAATLATQKAAIAQTAADSVGVKIDEADDKIAETEQARVGAIAAADDYVSRTANFDAQIGAAAGNAALAGTKAGEAATSAVEAKAARDQAVATNQLSEARITSSRGVTRTDGFGGSTREESADGRTMRTTGWQISDTPSDLPAPVHGDYTPWRDRPGQEGRAMRDSMGGVWDEERPGKVIKGGVILRRLPDGRSEVATRDGSRIMVAPADPQTFSPYEIDTLNLKALALRASVMSAASVSRLAGLDADYNVILLTGQSNMEGREAWPALTTSSVDGVMMLGNSISPTSLTGPTFTPYGSAVLNSAVATVLSTDRSSILNAAAQAALAAGAANIGESMGVAGAQTLRRWMLRSGVAPGTKKLIVINAAISGASIAGISYGTDNFARVISALNIVKGIATAEGKTIQLASIWHNQGEADSGVADPATFKAATEQFYADLKTYGSAGVFGQELAPSFILTQTAGWGITDLTNLNAQTAQVQMATTPGIFIDASRQSVGEKGLHIDPNGARWLGVKKGTIAWRLHGLRQGWKAMQPIDCRWRKDEALIAFHVPELPMQFADPYITNVATVISQRGMYFNDAVGVVTPSTIEIVADTVIRVRFPRAMTGPVIMHLGRRQYTFGRTGISDSDQSWSPFNYLYTPGSGQYADANVPALVGKPYPQQNWPLVGEYSLTEVP